MAKGKKESPAGKTKKPAGKKAGKPATAAKTGAGAASKSATKSKIAPAATKTTAAKGKGGVSKSATKSKIAPAATKTTAAKGKGGAKKVPSLPHLNDKVLRKIIAKLDDLHSESVRVVNLHMHEDLKQREESGDVGDDMDQASSERDREFSLLIHQRHLRRLKQVEDAYERIDEGTYGLCEGTEEPIDPKRLLIMPLARFSIEYQQQQEKMLGRSPEDGIAMSEEPMISDE